MPIVARYNGRAATSDQRAQPRSHPTLVAMARAIAGTDPKKISPKGALRTVALIALNVST